MNMYATLEEVPQAARDTLREASEIKYVRPHCLGGSTSSKALFQARKDPRYGVNYRKAPL